MRHLRLALAVTATLCLGIGDVSSAASAKTTAKPCSATMESDIKGHDAAVQKALRIPQIRKWADNLPKNVGMVLGFSDTQVEFDGACYWEVTFYENREEHAHLRYALMIPMAGKQIMIMDIVDGDYIPLHQFKRW